MAETTANHARFFVNRVPETRLQSTQALDLDLWRKRIQLTINQIILGTEMNAENGQGGLYTGLAGVAYMFMKAGLSETFEPSQPKRQEYLEKAHEYLKIPLYLADRPYFKMDADDELSFLLGSLGVYTINVGILTSLNQVLARKDSLAKISKMTKALKKMEYLRCGSDELFVGRAGYVCAVTWIRRNAKLRVVAEPDMDLILDVMLESGRDYASKEKSESPLMYAYYGTQYLGAAHGLASILQMFLNYPKWMRTTPDAERDIKATVDHLLSLQQPNGNFPCAMDELGPNSRPEEEELIHWCHGASGVVHLMAAAYLLWKEEKYLESCVRCADIVWKCGLLKKGPGICHGVAGNGYVFLALYRLTGDPLYLNKAAVFAHFMYTEEFQHARTPDYPYSLYEGLAGTVCFLLDMLDPDNAEFPFYSVFGETELEELDSDEETDLEAYRRLNPLKVTS